MNRNILHYSGNIDMNFSLNRTSYIYTFAAVSVKEKKSSKMQTFKTNSATIKKFPATTGISATRKMNFFLNSN